MLITLLLFLISAVTIYLACEYFVNGIEWTGHHFKLSQSATGSLLAALGTALAFGDKLAIVEGAYNDDFAFVGFERRRPEARRRVAAAVPLRPGRRRDIPCARSGCAPRA